MKKQIIFTLRFLLMFFLLLPGLFSQENKTKAKLKTIDDYYSEAGAAYQKKDYGAYLENLKGAFRLHPGFNGLKCHLAGAYALNGKKKESLEILKTAVDMGLIYPEERKSDFDSLKDSEEFKGLWEKLRSNRSATDNSRVAFVIPEKDLIPEGITHNPKTGSFYVTAIYKRKIVQISPGGKVSDFISHKQDGFWGGVGLEVDAKRQVMWVNCGTGNQMKDYKEEKEGQSAVFKYDLKSKKLIKKYLLADDKKHLLNDLTVASNGDVFLTDSDFKALYTISHARDKLELFLAPGLLSYPNGITLSGDGKYLYVAHLEGISRVDITRRTHKKLAHAENMSLTGIDGLYFHNGSLVAVQNYGGLNRVARFHLNKDGDSVEKLEVLEANHSLFIIPTTGVPVGNEFYYIANSQLGSFNADHTIFPMEKLKEVVILKVGLGQ
ncbi:MAG: hypothetical protein GY940_37990 [bacterium]|nr:hypothetical protein [bacterium]